MKKVILLSLSVFCSVIFALATRVYVAPEGSNTANDGLSWESPYATLAKATTVVGVTEIWMKAGTYAGMTSVNDFNANARNGVLIYGGFSGVETSIEERPKIADGKPWEFVNETIIDGYGSTICLPLPTLTSDNQTLFDGITFQNGYGTGATVHATGIRCTVSAKNITIQNCQFKNNSALSRGAAIYFQLGYSIQINNCYFYNNTGTINGGAIHLIAQDTNNKIKGCTFVNNSSQKGGGVYLNASTGNSTEMNNCTFIGNRALGTDGTGGMGGAFHSENANNKLNNLLIANNEGNPSAVSIYTGSELYNSTIVNNKGGVNGGSTTKIKNCIVWGNEDANANIVGISSTSPDVFNNAVYTSSTEGQITHEDTSVENLTEAPGFVMPNATAGITGATENDDWSLLYSSPLINKAITISGIDADILGIARPQGSADDLGAYELPYYNTTVTFSEGGSVNSLTTGDILSEPKGKQLEFTITPSAGMKIKSALYNGEEVKGDIVGGVYTAPALSANATLVVEFDLSTSINKLQSEINCYSLAETIEIHGLELGNMVYIYSITGAKLASRIATSSELSFNVGKGIFFVKVDDVIKKVVVE